MSIFNFVETYLCTYIQIDTHTDMFFYSMGYNLLVLYLGFLQMLISETTGL